MLKIEPYTFLRVHISRRVEDGCAPCEVDDWLQCKTLFSRPHNLLLVLHQFIPVDVNVSINKTISKSVVALGRHSVPVVAVRIHSSLCSITILVNDIMITK